MKKPLFPRKLLQALLVFTLLALASCGTSPRKAEPDTALQITTTLESAVSPTLKKGKKRKKVHGNNIDASELSQILESNPKLKALNTKLHNNDDRKQVLKELIKILDKDSSQANTVFLMLEGIKDDIKCSEIDLVVAIFIKVLVNNESLAEKVLTVLESSSLMTEDDGKVTAKAVLLVDIYLCDKSLARRLLKVLNGSSIVQKSENDIVIELLESIYDDYKELTGEVLETIALLSPEADAEGKLWFSINSLFIEILKGKDRQHARSVLRTIDRVSMLRSRWGSVCEQASLRLYNILSIDRSLAPSIVDMLEVPNDQDANFWDIIGLLEITLMYDSSLASRIMLKLNNVQELTHHKKSWLLTMLRFCASILEEDNLQAGKILIKLKDFKLIEHNNNDVCKAAKALRKAAKALNKKAKKKG